MEQIIFREWERVISGRYMTEEMIDWLLKADRRLVILKTISQDKLIKAADISKKTGRSLNNICYAIRELEERGLIRCITPEKRTWKRYLFTEKGDAVFKMLCNGDSLINDGDK